MQTARTVTMLVVSLVLTMTFGHYALAQQGNPQHVMQQQQMMRMGDMMQHMEHLQQRMQTMMQNMDQNMAQMQEHTRNQFQHMQHMNESMNAMIGEVKAAMERYQVMQQDETMLSDKMMQQDMKQLHDHFQDIAAQFEQTVRLLEQMNERYTQQAKH